MMNSKALVLSLCVALAGCAGHKKKPEPAPVPAQPSRTATHKPAEAEMSPVKRDIIELARREWEFFGRQTVVLDGEEESIPHVGKWEDDADAYIYRVNWYWRAVDKPHLDGRDCRQPWSAAFVSWIMREAGVSSYQFEPSEAHWGYLSRIVAEAGDPYAAFAPREIGEYSPRPGDLICATRGGPDEMPVPGQGFRSVLLEHTKLHCDIVVERGGDTLAAIGGNVRNSVSKTLLKLDPEGLVRPSQRRPWFMVLENRL
ncbi:DUF2272 domain-containing protein [Methylomagnum ishizawai]|nr:DUF2272 domain-containing protein [Methylomagnum ishizawai]